MKNRYPLTGILHPVRLLKLCLATVCLGLAGVHPAHAQSDAGMMPFRYDNIPLLDVLRDINQRTGNKVMYRLEEIEKENKPVTVNLPNATLLQGVKAVISGKDLSCSENGGLIIISPIEARPQSEDILLSGRVTTPDGRPLAGVAVMVRGTSQGVSTDANGRFRFTTRHRQQDIVLSFAFMGMEPVEMAYDGRAEIDVVMRESSTDIGTVVVTGIFEKPKESYTGAVTSITRQELRASGNRSLLTTIQNVDPSFNIIEDIAVGSDPNALPDINIRGVSSLDANIADVQDEFRERPNLPLFLLNGFEVSLQKVMDLDQSIIERIDILKDASATAMYGTRGANGVVVITTSKPAAGRLRLSYTGTVNIEAPDLRSYNLMNASEKLKYEYAAGLYSHSNATTAETLHELYNSRLRDVARGVDTYWLKYPVRTGVGNRHSMRLEGGREEIDYAVNVLYNDIRGAMKGSKRETLSGDVYLGYTYKNLSFKNDLIITFNKSKNSPYGSFSDFGTVNAYWKPYDDEGNLLKMLEELRTYPNIGRQYSKGNPLWNASLNNKDETQYTEIQNNFEAAWFIIPKELQLRGRFGFTRQHNRSDRFKPADHTDFDSYEDVSRKGEYIYGSGESQSVEASLTLSYSRTFADRHQLYAGAHASYASSNRELYTFAAEGIAYSEEAFIGDAVKYREGGSPVATEGLDRRLGAMVNVNYTYDGKYFADLSGNMEGSSKYGSDNRLAPFWSAGAGWNMHAEEWMAGSKWVDVARIRLSYGTSGSQNFPSYQAMTTYRVYPDANYEGWRGIYPYAMGNPDLGWQKTHTVNAGFDLELFGRRLIVSADFYDKKTDGVLADISLPSASGFLTYRANLGKLSNRGLELTLRGVIVRTSDWRLSVGATLAHNRNKILKISDSLEELNNQLRDQDRLNPSFLLEEGQSVNTIFAVRSLGIDPSSGKELFLDNQGGIKDKWDSAYQVACGTTDPKVWGNVNTSLSFRNLTLTAVFSYRAGGSYYNQTLANKVENIYPYDNADKRAYYDRWISQGDDALYKNVSDFSTTYASSRFIMKNDALSCKMVSLQYETHSEWLGSKLGISYLSVSAYMEDVFTISTIRQERGLSYPFARKFSLGLTLRF